MKKLLYLLCALLAVAAISCSDSDEPKMEGNLGGVKNGHFEYGDVDLVTLDQLTMGSHSIKMVKYDEYFDNRDGSKLEWVDWKDFTGTVSPHFPEYLDIVDGNVVMGAYAIINWFGKYFFEALYSINYTTEQSISIGFYEPLSLDAEAKCLKYSTIKRRVTGTSGKYLMMMDSTETFDGTQWEMNYRYLMVGKFKIEKLRKQDSNLHMFNSIDDAYDFVIDLFNTHLNGSYDTWKIPKHSGGFRITTADLQKEKESIPKWMNGTETCPYERRPLCSPER